MFVIYNTETTRLITLKNRFETAYKTLAAAKAARTRMIKKGWYKEDAIAIADQQTYTTLIEQTVERVNLMSGKVYRESVNTPSYCSPSSEAYWSM